MFPFNYKTITFFYPSRLIGGAEMLFLRLARILSDTLPPEVQIHYVDFKDGFVSQEISNNNDSIKVIFYDTYKFVHLSDDGLLITPLSSIFEVARFCLGNPHVFLWSTHPFGLKEMVLANNHAATADTYRQYGTNLENFIHLNGIHFMDGPNFHIQKDIFYLSLLEVDYLPIFSRSPRLSKSYNTTFSKKSYSFGWVGRLCVEKTNALINVIRHSNSYLRNHPEESITFHIIGDGDMKESVLHEPHASNLEIIFVGILSGAELDQYLVENIDLMFAMGTSSLECASLNVATVLVDFSYSTIPVSNRFRFLYQSEEFSVGDEYKIDVDYPFDMNGLISLLKNGEIAKHAELCLHYFMQFHSESSVSTKFLQVAQEVQLTLSDIRESKFGQGRGIYILKSIYYSIKRWLKI
ncbi:hypothetical protein B0I21_10419 [Sphingobacterium paludis]|uniref:Glycosyltransferase involved in cell wall biosynthesis n=2 Tax=Sphingobacterium paludis TaxID=1476465 RepID=A0A4R7CYL2_9SPHI|nr:hypothetical protein B0I21_10419 [Sphingobacterium paludis]